ncbi:ROK family protein [Microbacterium sp. SLBN-146]|uniref:ROK family protein n=1 Tax=Microbacterium sp. SLBN-146 TaxID=2768457 RepID=UPI001152CB10|nr:ROK family protein [Microbacterium sp. SLBN-146]TQJ30955.1 glucokinase [Microbacterium sp. SLBN-146]
MTAVQHPLRDDADADGDRVVLAVDLGGTKVEAGLVTADGDVRTESVHRAPTGRERSADEILDAVGRVAASALSARRTSDRLVGAGIGSAGPVDLVAGTASPLNLPAAEGLPLVTLVRGLVDAPVRLALDGTCIALAEHAFGAARGARNALAMVVSTGVGGGLIIDGMPVTGVSGNAGHLGQTRLRGRSESEPATVGTLEAIASGPSSVVWARSQGWHGDTGEALAEAYGAGDPIAVAAVRRSAGAVGEAIASTSTLLDLDVAVIAGGFAAVAPDYLDLVRASADASTVFSYAKRVRIVASGLDGRGPLVGAAALALR